MVALWIRSTTKPQNCKPNSGRSILSGREGAAGLRYVALAVSGMNDVLNSQGYTQAAWWNRIPIAAWAMMGLIAIAANVMVGYGARRRGALLFVLPIRRIDCIPAHSRHRQPARRNHSCASAKHKVVVAIHCVNGRVEANSAFSCLCQPRWPVNDPTATSALCL